MVALATVRANLMFAAVYSLGIDLLNGNLELLDTVCELGCERFVDLSDEVSIPFLQKQVRHPYFPDINILLRQTRLRKNLRNSHCWRDAHIAWLDAYKRACNVFAEDTPTFLLRPCARREDTESCTIADTARIACCGGAVFQKHRLELCERLEGDSWSDSIIYRDNSSTELNGKDFICEDTL